MSTLPLVSGDNSQWNPSMAAAPYGLTVGMLAAMAKSTNQAMTKWAYEEMVRRGMPHDQIALAIDHADPNVTGAFANMMNGMTPQQILDQHQREGSMQGMDAQGWLTQLNTLQNAMNGVGIQGDTNHGYPIDSPFNPNNPNSVFAQIAKRDGTPNPYAPSGPQQPQPFGGAAGNPDDIAQQNQMRSNAMDSGGFNPSGTNTWGIQNNTAANLKNVFGGNVITPGQEQPPAAPPAPPAPGAPPAPPAAPPTAPQAPGSPPTAPQPPTIGYGPGQTRPDSFATGTNYVPQTQLAQIHQGEAIIPANQNPSNPGATLKASFGGAMNPDSSPGGVPGYQPPTTTPAPTASPTDSQQGTFQPPQGWVPDPGRMGGVRPWDPSGFDATQYQQGQFFRPPPTSDPAPSGATTSPPVYGGGSAGGFPTIGPLGGSGVDKPTYGGGSAGGFPTIGPFGGATQTKPGYGGGSAGGFPIFNRPTASPFRRQSTRRAVMPSYFGGATKFGR